MNTDERKNRLAVALNAQPDIRALISEAKSRLAASQATPHPVVSYITLRKAAAGIQMARRIVWAHKNEERNR